MVSVSSGIPQFRDSSAQALVDSRIPRVRGSQASRGGQDPRVVLGEPDILRVSP